MCIQASYPPHRPADFDRGRLITQEVPGLFLAVLTGLPESPGFRFPMQLVMRGMLDSEIPDGVARTKQQELVHAIRILNVHPSCSLLI